MLAGGAKLASRNTGDQSPRPSSLRRIVRVGLAAFLLGIVGLSVGFVWFVERIPMGDVALTQDADGIVVLTGRASRIGEAIELLASKHGKRLLITGVYPTTTAAAIARLVPEHQQLFADRVDLDHSAVNTVGNAVQTRIWAKKNDIRSLIVVTSNYHMPRALIELAHQLPEVVLVSYPIAPDRMAVESWWSNFTITRLLFAEYLKYMRAVVRTQTPFVLSRPGSS